jgi:hypothetical protein
LRDPIKIWQNGLTHHIGLKKFNYQLNSKIRLRKENVHYPGMRAFRACAFRYEGRPHRSGSLPSWRSTGSDAISVVIAR